ncbi:helix-turn-helix transcriptional regulator [Flavobacterium alkalisoli]|uniref:Helix-turn-helix transcriptional regulator n=1 Tax=Flavobacterium alkalisoli TaxID=2602769 RepID=A0A5B9FXV0_9FLAO|nr:helix-turn-helix transcriptional regulator [Flavobacterium alkalisoli]QEE50588.1 helix-turn-helix transcriptional regulator [Flavobacterium alkalisoli]
MNYKTYIPTENLNPYVRFFWSLDNSMEIAPLQSFRAMADGCPGIIFQHPDDGCFYQKEKALPQIFLYGQSTKFTELTLKGKMNAIGIYLHPSSLKLIFGLNPEELTDSCLDVNELCKKTGFSLLEQLNDAKTVKQRIEILSVFLFLHIKANDFNKNEVMAYALSAIMRSGGNIILRDLQEQLQMSERTFERKFKEYVGITPKLFTRICRFQSSLNQMRNNTFEKLSDVAFQNDYSDQSHFIRSFREFAGFSPNQYQNFSKEVVENLSQLKK